MDNTALHANWLLDEDPAAVALDLVRCIDHAVSQLKAYPTDAIDTSAAIARCEKLLNKWYPTHLKQIGEISLSEIIWVTLAHLHVMRNVELRKTTWDSVDMRELHGKVRQMLHEYSRVAVQEKDLPDVNLLYSATVYYFSHPRASARSEMSEDEKMAAAEDEIEEPEDEAEADKELRRAWPFIEEIGPRVTVLYVRKHCEWPAFVGDCARWCFWSVYYANWIAQHITVHPVQAADCRSVDAFIANQVAYQVTQLNRMRVSELVYVLYSPVGARDAYLRSNDNDRAVASSLMVLTEDCGINFANEVTKRIRTTYAETTDDITREAWDWVMWNRPFISDLGVDFLNRFVVWFGELFTSAEELAKKIKCMRPRDPMIVRGPAGLWYVQTLTEDSKGFELYACSSHRHAMHRWAHVMRTRFNNCLGDGRKLDGVLKSLFYV